MNIVSNTDVIWKDGRCQRLQLDHELTSTLDVYYVPFQADYFDAGWFQISGISLPGHIAMAAHKRQVDFFYGRLCARAALEAQGYDCEVGTGAMRAPVWPKGIIGSITHGKRLAAAVVLSAYRCRGIGIDFEDIVGQDIYDALCFSVLSPREYALLKGLNSRLNLDVLLTLVFSAKESFFKATAAVVGRYFDFDAIVFRDIDFQRNELLLEVAIPLCPSWGPGMPVRIGYRQPFSGGVITFFAW